MQALHNPRSLYPHWYLPAEMAAVRHFLQQSQGLEHCCRQVLPARYQILYWSCTGNPSPAGKLPRLPSILMNNQMLSYRSPSHRQAWHHRHNSSSPLWHLSHLLHQVSVRSCSSGSLSYCSVYYPWYSSLPLSGHWPYYWSLPSSDSQQTPSFQVNWSHRYPDIPAYWTEYPSWSPYFAEFHRLLQTD